MTTIATLIPAYNAARYIACALDSVAAQRRLPDEIIVVDDGSADNTKTVVQEWTSARPNLRVKLIHQPNLGASGARNAAILASRADLIAFLDADDMLDPEHHVALSSALIGNPDVIAAFGDQAVFSEGGELCASFLAGTPVEGLPQEVKKDGFRVIREGLWGALIQGNFIPTSASMTYREAAIEIGNFDTDLATSEDRDFWLRVSRRGAFGYTPRRLAHKREHEGNLTRDANALLVARQAFDVVLKQLRLAPSLKLDPIEDTVTRRFLQMAANRFLYIASTEGLTAYRAARQYLRYRAPEVLEFDLLGWLRALTPGAAKR